MSYLLPQHLAKLEASAIDQTVAGERDYRSVTEKVVLERYGLSRTQRRVPALLIPVYGVTGEILLHQARPDAPRMNGKGKAVKYETPGGSRMVLDVHPRARERIGDPKVPLWITEGVLKGDALVSQGECAVALLGVWNWRGTNSEGGKTVLSDFESVALNGRDVYLAFDSDASTKPEVHKALERLKALLERRDARVRIAYLDDVDNEKTGIDDYLAAGGSLDELRDAAEFTLRPPPQPEEPEPTAEEPEESYEGELPTLADLLDNLSAFQRRYVVMTPEQIVFLALWIFHTHAFAAADCTPYPNVRSPEMESGKSLTFEVLELVTARSVLVAGGTTSAALKRAASEKPERTILLDESDNTFKQDKEFVAATSQILNAGYRRGGRALLCMPPSWEIEFLEVFCPKAFAGIGMFMSDTTASRSVPIDLKRKTRDEHVERFRRRNAESLARPLRQAAAALADQHIDELRLARPELREELSDRQQDIWEPLFAIADLAGGSWPKQARSAAITLHGSLDNEESSAGVQLLAAIRGVFGDDERLTCSALVDLLNHDDQLPYGGWSDGKGITTRELGKKLRPYKIKAKTIRLPDEKTAKGYTLDQFEDAFSRYLPSERDTRDTTVYPSQRQTENEPTQDADVPLSEDGANPHDFGDVSVVSLSDQGVGNGHIPVPGDDDFVALIAEAHRHGDITEAEAKERWTLHQLILEARPVSRPTSTLEAR